MERPAQLVYEGSRSFRKYEFTIEIVVINLYKFGVFEVLLRDQDSQCALPPIYLRSEIIEHRIKPADIDVLMIDSRHLFDPTELLNDDDLYDLVVRVQIFNFIADRLSIKKRAPDSTVMYEVEYLPALFDPEFGPGKKYRLDRLICDDPYSFGAPAPLEENLSLTKQGTADTILSTSVCMNLDRHSTASAERGANISSKTPGLGVSSRVSSALRTLTTLTTLFGSAKSRSIRPISEERERGVASAATYSNSNSNSNRSKLSRSGSQDRSDMAVQRRLDAQDSFKRSGSNKNFNTETNFNSNSDPATTAAPVATTVVSGKQQPYHESASGRQGQALAHRMLSRLGDLPDIPDALLGTVIYLPGSLADADAERETDSGRNRAGGAAGAGVGGVGSGGGVYHMGHMRHLHHLQHAAALEAAAHAGSSSSSKKTVSQHRLAEYFQPLPLFRSIEDLCDPSVIERIPHRQHPCLQPPKCVSRLSVSVFSGASSTEPESTKTEAYNHPTNFTNYTTYTSFNAYKANTSYPTDSNSNNYNKNRNGAFATYYSAQEEFLHVHDISSECPYTSPNIGSPYIGSPYIGSPYIGSPRLSGELEHEEQQLYRDLTKTLNANNNSNTSNSRELEAHASFNQQSKPNTHIRASTNSATAKNSTGTRLSHSKVNTAATSEEWQVRRSVLPLVSMLRSALLGHSRVGVAAGGGD